MFRRRAAVLLLAGLCLTPYPALAQTPRGADIPVNQHYKDYQFRSRVAVAPDGGFVVVWMSAGNVIPQGPSRAWYRLFAADGSARTPERQVNSLKGMDGPPDVAMDADGGFIVVWDSGDGRSNRVYGRSFDSAGAPAGAPFPLTAAPSTGAQQYDATLDIGRDGSFVAAWIEGPRVRDFERLGQIHARRFEASGQPLGAAFQVSTLADRVSVATPRVGVDASGGFTVGWSSASQGVGVPGDIFIRRFASNGAPLGIEVQVNPERTWTLPSLFDLDVAPDGETVVVWTTGSDGSDPASLIGIQGRLYAADGSPGSPFNVNAGVAGTQARPAVTFGPGGEFFVAWVGNAAPVAGIFSRRFLAGGTPRGGDVKVALSPRRPPTTNDYPDVALNEAGQGAVTWTRFRFDSDVFARRLLQNLP